MIVDCDACAAPAAACRDCVMTVLCSTAGRRDARAPVDLDAAEHHALGQLARAGLVPPLRLVVGRVVGLAGGVDPAGRDERWPGDSDNSDRGDEIRDFGQASAAESGPRDRGEGGSRTRPECPDFVVKHSGIA